MSVKRRCHRAGPERHSRTRSREVPQKGRGVEQSSPFRSLYSTSRRNRHLADVVGMLVRLHSVNMGDKQYLFEYPCICRSLFPHKVPSSEMNVRISRNERSHLRRRCAVHCSRRERSPYRSADFSVHRCLFHTDCVKSTETCHFVASWPVFLIECIEWA